jgi:hypothetical protein
VEVVVYNAALTDTQIDGINTFLLGHSSPHHSSRPDNVRTASKVAFKTAHGTYLSAWTAEEGVWLIKQKNHNKAWEHFELGLTGNGFTLKTAHNLYVSACWGDDPQLQVRQRQMNHNQKLEQFEVIFNGDGTISLKTAQGQFISAWNNGTVRCKEHNKGWERFTPIPVPE